MLVLAGLACLPGSAAAQISWSYLTRLEYIPYPDSDIVLVKLRMHIPATATEIAVPGAPWSVAASADGRWAYVVRRLANAVSVIDAVSRNVVASIPVGVTPLDVAVTPDGSKAYVANSGSGTVSVIDTATNTVVATIPIAGSPSSVAATPDGVSVLVAHGADMSVIDTATDTPSALVPLTHPADRIAIRPDGLRAYVSLPGFDQVAVVDVTSRTQIQSIPVGAQPRGLAVSPNGAMLFVANFGGSVTVIDTASHAVLPGGVAQNLLAAPLAVAFNSNAIVRVSDRVQNRAIAFLAAHLQLGAGIAEPSSTGPAFLTFGPALITGDCPDFFPVCAGTVTNGASLWDSGEYQSMIFHAGGSLVVVGDLTTSRLVSLLPAQPASGYLTNDGRVTLLGDIVNGGRLVKSGSGTLTVAGARIEADFSIDGGTLDVAANVSGAVSVASSGAVLSGTATVGTIDAPMGSVRPGGVDGNAPGVLRAGQAALGVGTRFIAQIDGPAPGTGYDQLDASGTAALNGSTLDVRPGYAPVLGATFTIVTHATGTFAGLPEGARLAASGRVFDITYRGGGGSDVVLTYVGDDVAPTLAPSSDLAIDAAAEDVVTVSLTVGDDGPLDALTFAATSGNQTLVPDAGLSFSGTGASRTLAITRVPDVSNLSSEITVSVSDAVQTTRRTFRFTVNPRRFYLMAEGSTGPFFSTDIAIANPHATDTPIKVAFFKQDGTSVRRNMTLAPMSRTTLHVKDIPGMEATSFTTGVISGSRIRRDCTAANYGFSIPAPASSATWTYQQGAAVAASSPSLSAWISAWTSSSRWLRLRRPVQTAPQAFRGAGARRTPNGHRFGSLVRRAGYRSKSEKLCRLVSHGWACGGAIRPFGDLGGRLPDGAKPQFFRSTNINIHEPGDRPQYGNSCRSCRMGSSD